MKIYLGSNFDNTKRVIQVCEALEKEGHKIPVKWWLKTELNVLRDKICREDFYSIPECKFAYERDKLGIENADIFILVAEEEIKSYNGALIESGIAFECGKPCICLGNLRNSAMYYPFYWVNSITELLDLINKLKETYQLS